MYIYIVSAETEGDGSGNCDGYDRPGISLFTNLKDLKKELQKYINEEYYYLLNNDELDIIIKNGGIKYDNDFLSQIRIQKIDKSEMNKKIQSSHWDNWKLENVPYLKKEPSKIRYPRDSMYTEKIKFIYDNKN